MHKTQNGKMLGAAISGPALDNLLKLGQAIAGALTIPSSYVWAPCSPTCALVEHSTASGLIHPQPKPGSRITIYLGLASGEKNFFFSSGSWWDSNL